MTRSQRRNWDKFCSEPLELIENYQQALSEGFAGWCMHHRREIKQDGTRVSAQELKDNGLYYDRPAEELVFMRREEHISLHSKGKHHSEETRQKLSEAKKGENNPFFGKHLSEESRQKMSEAHKGRTSPRKGVTLSEETRKKMSEAAKRRCAMKKNL